MILILTGPEARVREHCRADFQPDDRVLWVDEPASFGVPWGLPRRILPQLRVRLGDAPVERALAAHPVAASLLLPRLASRLSAAEAARRAGVVARLDSHMTHNDVVQQRIREECAALLVALLRGWESTIVIPDIARLDWPSLDLLTTTYRLFEREAPRLVLGLDPSRAAEPDAEGICRRSSQAALKTFVYGFHGLGGFVRRGARKGDAPERVASAGAEETGGPERLVDPLDDDLEWQVYHALGRGVEPLSEAERARALGATRRAFEAYSFRAAMLLARRWIDRDPELEGPARAEAHGILALSAHNRQFLSRGNLPLARFLEGHYREALAAEEDPCLRVCLLYRLAVTLGRRQGRLEAAREATDQALAELQTARLPEVRRTTQEAWIRNIRAYLEMRGGRLDEAFAEEEASLALLARSAELSEDGVEENVLSRAVIADHLAELASLARDDETRHRWHRVTEELVGRWPQVEKLMARMWMIFRMRELRLSEAVEHGEAALALAREDFEFVLEYSLTAHLGDLHYRLGDLSRALAYYEEAAEFRDLLGDDAEIRLPIEAPLAAAALRVGEPDRAERELRRLLEEARRDEDPARHAQSLALLGVVAAAQENRDEADRRINQAIELAVALGERDVLLRVALAAGEACLRLQRRDQARQAFEQALEMAGAEDEGTSPPARPGDLLEAVVGLGEAGGDVARWVGPVLESLPEALREDPESWWCLPRFLPLLRSRLARGEARGSGAGRLEELPAFVRLAAAQRADCADLLPELELGRGRGAASSPSSEPEPAPGPCRISPPAP